MIALTNEDGTIANNNGTQQRFAYDPWGNRRNPLDWTQRITTAQNYITDRGYTLHEHLDDFALINMNGRVYDPAIARFLSPDPLLQAPNHWLSYNRYAYCMNNPMLYTDPSGMSWFSDLWDWAKGNPLINPIAGLDWLNENIAPSVNNFLDNNNISVNAGVGYSSGNGLYTYGGNQIFYHNQQANSTEAILGRTTVTLNGTSREEVNFINNLGISWDNVTVVNGLYEGAVGGVKATINNIKDLVSGDFNVYNEMLVGQLEMMLMPDLVGRRMSWQLSQNAVLMSKESGWSYTLSYGTGFVLEKAFEIFVLRKAIGTIKTAPNVKLMRGSGGKINGITISKGSGYGAKPRFDFHKLANTYNTRKSSRMTIPKWLDGKKLPHWHRGKGNNLKYHRPWEIGPDGKRRW